MECGSRSLSKRTEAEKIPEDVARERQEGRQYQWQQESPVTEVLEQVRANADMGCGAQMMRKSFFAIRDGSCVEFKEGCREKENSSEWTLEKIREAHERVAREEVGSLGLVQEILVKSTDFPRRIIAPVGGRGKSHLVENLPALQQFLSLEDHTWWVSTGHGSNNRKKRHCSWRCGVCGGKYEWRAPNSILVVQLGTNAEEATVFRAHVVPQGLCENLINALKLLTNQQRDGDCPVQNIGTGLYGEVANVLRTV